MKRTCPARYKRANGESGVALILALVCLFIVSTIAVGVMYSTQSEIWSTANYQATTEARYVAEAGAQQAVNFIANSSNFPVPTALLGSGTTYLNLNAFPITTNTNATLSAANQNKPLIMATSGYGNSGNQYADTWGAIDTALNSAVGDTSDTTFQGFFCSGSTCTANTKTPFASLAGGNSNAQFDVAIQLLTANQNTDGSWDTRWKIVSQGSLNTLGSQTGSTVGSSSAATAPRARVQVVEIVDKLLQTSSSGSTSPSFDAGVFATGTGCNTISMSGGQYTNSYNSTAQPGNSSPTLSNTGGDVATFGNVSVTSGAYILGNVYTPHYNLGTTGTYGISGGPWPGLNSSTACSTATGGTEWAVNEDNSGSGVGCTSQSSSSCSQKTYNLPSPPPSFPTPVMPTVAANTAACTGYNGLCSGGSGGGSGCSITIPPSTLPSGSAGTGAANFGAVNFGSCAVITLQAGTYNMDSLLISNGATVNLPAAGSVVINILDNGSTATPLNINGGTVANSGGAPKNLTIAYAGSKPISVDAGANMFGTIYAPNAAATFSGNAGLYGAVVCKTASFQGSGHVVYDTSLANSPWNVSTSGTPTSTAGPLHIDEFSWSAF